MSLFEKMQRTAKHQYEGMGTRLFTCKVTGINPLKVKINENLELTEELLIFPESLQERILQVKDYKTTASSGGDICSGSSLTEVIRTCILQPKIKVGDRLIVSAAGEEYVILDKVGDPNATISYTAE